MGNRLSQILGQSFIIENKPGASGTLATAQVRKMPADGATLLMSESGQVVMAP